MATGSRRGGAVAGAVAALLVLWAPLLHHLQQKRSDDLAQARRDVTNISAALAEQVARLIVGADQIARLMQDDFRRDAAAFDLASWVARTNSLGEVTKAINVFDEHGKLVASSVPRRPGAVAPDISDRAEFKSIASRADAGLVVGRTYRARVTTGMVMPLYRRLEDGNGRFRGVLGLSIDPGYVAGRFASLDVGSDGSLALFGLDGYVRARTPFVEGMYDRDVLALPSRAMALADLARSAATTIALDSAFDGRRRIFGYRAVKNLPLFITAGRSEAEVLAPFRREAVLELTFGVIASILILAALWLSMRTARDRSARRRILADAHAALARSEARYRLLAESTSDVITRLSLPGFTRDYVSPACSALFGRDPQEMLGKVPSEEMHPDDAADVRRRVERFALGAEAERRLTVTYRSRHQDGRWIWVETCMILARDDAGVPAALICSLRDVTERRRAEAARAASEHRFRLLAENTGELIILIEADGRRSYISSASERLLGFTPRELDLEMRERRWLHPGDAAALSGASLDAAGESSFSCRVARKDGAWIWIEAIVRRIAGAGDGEPTIIATLRDISEREAKATALREAKEAAEHANKAKSDFLATMSHEIRTPLNAILGYADLLLRDDLTEGPRRYLDRIRNAGSALRTVVDDVLDFSKLEAGRVEIHAAPFAPSALVDNATSIVRGLAKEKGLDLVVAIGTKVPETLVGDHDRLRQILLNLLNNAIKFTRAGSVTLSVGCTKLADGRVSVRFSVADTGIGIAGDKRSRLFQRFSQVDGSISREYGGTGLGLAICRSLVEAMGGRIGVDSILGRGSDFWVELAMEAGGAAFRVPGAEVAATAAKSVLLAEDQVINQELARAIVEGAGHSMDVVGDGAAAVAAVSSKAYDLVLMDVSMPIMDGIEATRRIRALDGVVGKVPIVAMTANVLPAQVAAFIGAGMDRHVGKPFKPMDLLAAIAEPRRKGPPMRASGDAGGEAVIWFDEAAFGAMRTALGDATASRLMSQALSQTAALICVREAASDRVRLAAGAHAVLGVVGTLGLAELARCLRAIEYACLSEQDLGEILSTAVLAYDRAFEATGIRRLGSAA